MPKTRHQQAIDALIPIASNRADDRVLDLLAETGATAEEINYDAVWTRYFSQEMDRLAVEKGLRRAVPKELKPRRPFAKVRVLH